MNGICDGTYAPEVKGSYSEPLNAVVIVLSNASIPEIYGGLGTKLVLARFK